MVTHLFSARQSRIATPFSCREAIPAPGTVPCRPAQPERACDPPGAVIARNWKALLDRGVAFVCLAACMILPASVNAADFTTDIDVPWLLGEWQEVDEASWMIFNPGHELVIREQVSGGMQEIQMAYTAAGSRSDPNLARLSFWSTVTGSQIVVVERMDQGTLQMTQRGRVMAYRKTGDTGTETLPELSGFQRIRGQSPAGTVMADRDAVTLEECARDCVQQASFQCTGFIYVPGRTRCWQTDQRPSSISYLDKPGHVFYLRGENSSAPVSTPQRAPRDNSQDRSAAAGSPAPRAGPDADSRDTLLTSTWSSNFNRMHISQQGKAIEGTYEYAGGRIIGTLENRVFKGWWKEDDDARMCGPNNDWSGPAILTFSADGSSFAGRYGKCLGGIRTFDDLAGRGGDWAGNLETGSVDVNPRQVRRGDSAARSQRRGDTAVDAGPLGQFTRTPDAAISGHNNRQLTGVSPADCATACLSERDFDCRSFDYYKDDRKCDLSDKHAEDVGGLKDDYGNDPYDHYSLPGRHSVAEHAEPLARFQVTRDAAISGHNVKSLRGATPADCARACLDARDFSCKSFDYYKYESACDLSDKRAFDVGGLKRDYSNDPYDHYSLVLHRSGSRGTAASQDPLDTSALEAELRAIVRGEAGGNRW